MKNTPYLESNNTTANANYRKMKLARAAQRDLDFSEDFGNISSKIETASIGVDRKKLHRCRNGACCSNNLFSQVGPMGYSDKTELLQKLFETDLNSDTFMSKLIENGSYGFGGSRLLEDFGDPKLGELLYSDKVLTQKEVERKGRWLHDVYGSVSEKSSYKT